MIDLGHIILLIIAMVSAVIAYQGSKKVKKAQSELDVFRYNQLIEEVKRDSISQSPNDRLSKFNKRYGSGSSTPQ